MTKIAIIDVDDVCAELITGWLGRYNSAYHDHLAPRDITSWNVDKFVKDECKGKMYALLSSDLYDSIKPVRGALEGVNGLRKLGFRVVFCTALVMRTAGRKFQWLNDNGFSVDQHDYIECSDKSLVMGDIMFDDRYENARDFTGLGVLFTKPWNASADYENRAKNWKEFLQKAKRLL